MSNQCDVIKQIRRSRLSISMPLRYDNLVSSPYPTYKQSELDMRRKAEILEYKATANSNRSNNLTKTQKYVQIVNGTYAPKTCPNTIIYKPNYNSDVPGPVQDLYLDSNIPLYNYQVVREYTDLYFTDDTQWKYTSYSNIPCDINNNPLIGSLYIKDNIDDTAYNFTLKIPINIYVSGINSNNYDIDFVRQNSYVQILSVSCNVYYNGNLLNSPNVVRRVEPTYDLNNCYKLIVNTSNSGDNLFSANIFSGYIIINNINLYTAKGYIYDFHLSINSILNINDENYVQSDYYKKIEYFVVVNSTSMNQSSNCIVNTSNTFNQKIVSISGTNSTSNITTSNISL